MIDLLPVPPDANEIKKSIWEGLTASLDQEGFMAGTRERLCDLFADRFELAKNQELYGLDEKSEAYNVRLNQLVREWKADLVYVTGRLAWRLRARHKAIIVNIDNTDQYDEALQELCFSIGQSIAATFPCVVIISMREERFYTSSIRGVLDAFQNSGFHITSPEPKEVFLKRIGYVRSQVLNAESSGEYPAMDREVVASFLRIMEQNFRDKSSHLANFLTACSHGNIRLALELFRGFVVSGYTNVREMTANERWTLQIHQVIKPFMVPNRFFYSESLSRIPNIFQIRSKSHGSHFTGLRILASLIQGHDNKNPPFVPVAKLCMPFVEHFAMREDFAMNMDVLLKHGLVEANNRLDVFTEVVDSVRITTYGLFMLNVLSHDFTYLELTAEDCAVSDLEVSNRISELSNDEYRYFTSRMSMERVEVRLERAEVFSRYLSLEEERECGLYRSGVDSRFTASIRAYLERERIKVLRSARKNVPKKRYL